MKKVSNASSSIIGNRSKLNRHGNISSTILSNNLSGGDIEELFLNSARDGAYDRLLKLLSSNSGASFLSVNLKDKRTGNTALIWACKRGHIKIVQLLLSYGADITIRNYNGESSIEVASPVIKQIILDSVDHGGASYTQRLLQAAWLANHSAVNSILSNSHLIDLECVNCDGFTPLLLCTRDLYTIEKISPQLLKHYEPTAVVNDLIQCGANTLACDSEGKTALHYCASSKASVALSLTALLSQNSKIDAQDRKSLTPLHYACQAGNTDIVKVLLDCGSNVNSQGFAGTTPLHIAAFNNMEHLAKILLQHGADAHAVDDSGHTPIDVARFKKFRTMLRTWRRTGSDSASSNARISPKGSDVKNTLVPVGGTNLFTDVRIQNILTPIENTTPIRTIRRERTRLLGEPRDQRSTSSPEVSHLGLARSSSVNPALSDEQAARVHRIDSAHSRSISATDIGSLAVGCLSASNRVTYDERKRKLSYASPTPRLAPITDQVSPMPDLLDNSFHSRSGSLSEDPLISRQYYSPAASVAEVHTTATTKPPSILKAEFVVSESRRKTPPDIKPSAKQKTSNIKTNSNTISTKPNQRKVVKPALKSSMSSVQVQPTLSKVQTSSKKSSSTFEQKPTILNTPKTSAQIKVVKPSNKNSSNKSAQDRVLVHGKGKPWADDDVTGVSTDIENDRIPNRESRSPKGQSSIVLNSNLYPQSSLNTITSIESQMKTNISLKPTMISSATHSQSQASISKTNTPPHSAELEGCSRMSTLQRNDVGAIETMVITDVVPTPTTVLPSGKRDTTALTTSDTSVANADNSVKSATVVSNSLFLSKSLTITNSSAYTSLLQNNEFMSNTMKGKDLEVDTKKSDSVSSTSQSPSLVEQSCLLANSNSLTESESRSQKLDTLRSGDALNYYDKTSTLRPSFKTSSSQVAQSTETTNSNSKSRSSHIRSQYQPLHLLMNRPMKLSQVAEEQSNHSAEEDRELPALTEEEEHNDNKVICSSTMKQDKAFTLTISQQERISKHSIEEPHTGPVIEDIFENFPRPLYEFATVVAQDLVNKKVTPKKKKKKTPNSSAGNSRSNSGVNSKRVKNSNIKTNTIKQKGKLKKEAKTDKKVAEKESLQTDPENMALISGVGWHIETDRDANILDLNAYGGEHVAGDSNTSQSEIHRPHSFINMSPRQKREELKKMLMLLRRSNSTNVMTHGDTTSLLPQTMQAIHDFMNSMPDENELNSLFGLDNAGQQVSQSSDLVPLAEESVADDCSVIDLNVEPAIVDEINESSLDKSGQSNTGEDRELYVGLTNQSDVNESNQDSGNVNGQSVQRESTSNGLAAGSPSALNTVEPTLDETERCASTPMTDIIDEILNTPRRFSMPFAYFPQLSLQQPSDSDSYSDSESDESLTSESDSESTGSDDSADDEESDRSEEGLEHQQRTQTNSVVTVTGSKKNTLSFTEVDNLPIAFPLLDNKKLTASLNAVINPELKEVISVEEDSLIAPPVTVDITGDDGTGEPHHLLTWKKGNILGKGAYGTVYCGLTSDGHLIAVKQIELNIHDWEKAEKEYESIQEEVELLRNLNHTNIVGFLGTSLDNHVVSIYMQFVPGGTIASLLDRFGAFEERVFQKYTKQIVDGVYYLHTNGVIHRDIKGGNIMLMSNGVIKLIDFGCAKRLYCNLSINQSQVLKSMKGTPYWMAPEVIKETGHGVKSDIWSIGCSVFEMATTKPPWYEMAPMAAVFAIGSDKPIPQLPETCSSEAREFVSLCLQRDQKERSSASQLLESSFLTSYTPAN